MTAGWTGRLSAAALVLALLSGCTDDSLPSASEYANELESRVTTDALMAHLRQLQTIADANGGNRLTGTPGYLASVDYVVKVLRDSGFDVQTPEFDVGLFRLDSESLTVNGAAVPAQAVDFSGSSSSAGVSGSLVAVPSERSLGCDVTDYDGLPIRNAIAVVDRGSCLLSAKAAAATERGAAALIIVNDADERVFSGGLLEEDNVGIPVISVSPNDGARLRTLSGTANVVVDARVEHLRAQNVIAQTKTGSTEDIVMAGAHLDSVRRGPGIDDNGTGVAALLETAVQMGGSAPIQNAVRFAFWGGEEEFLLGSTAYIRALDVEQLKKIALYLNFDMIGSPNPGYFTLDGNGTSPVDPADAIPVPEGSAAIEQDFIDYLHHIGITAQDLPFDGRGDYDAFAQAGIPAGQLFTGAEEVKTKEQAELWGGQAGQPFDPNYHTADDTIAGVNRAVLDITGPVIAHAIGSYAQDLTALPARVSRARTQLQ